MNLDTFLEELRAAAADRYQKRLVVEEKHTIPSPKDIPLEGERWFKFDDVSCLYVDMVKSTELSVRRMPESVAKLYTLFTSNVVRILNEFEAEYVDVRGDGAFGLFTGDLGLFKAVAAAITAKTFIAKKARDISKSEIAGFTLASHAGLHFGRLLVKRLGLRGEMQNEVWAGRPVNVAAKLASRAGADELLVSGSVFERLKSDWIRRSCGCRWEGDNLVAAGDKVDLWFPVAVDKGVFGFDEAFVLRSNWCPTHGEETCNAILGL